MINAFWFPSESDLAEREIVYQHIIQKPGDAIYSGNAVYHWVYAPVNIFCIDMKQKRRLQHCLESCLVALFFLQTGFTGIDS